MIQNLLCFFLSSQVIEGYEKACKKALEILPDCVCSSAKNLHDVNEAASYIRTAVASKQYGNEEFLANLIAQACGELILQTVDTGLIFFLSFKSFHINEIIFHFVTVSIFPESGSFNVDNVRVCKILVRICFFLLLSSVFCRILSVSFYFHLICLVFLGLWRDVVFHAARHGL